MTAKELAKRNDRSEGLRVLQAEDKQQWFVESNEGKILYRVGTQDGDTLTCTCGDYAANVKRDSNFQCKHIIAVLSCVPSGEVDQANFLEKAKPKLDERFIKTIEGRDFVLYSGLLDLAHQKGLVSITVEPIQYPTSENGNMAICRAIAQSRSGSFTDVGDANSTNCNPKVAKHLLRMASTRAKARCLRDMNNIGMTCLEELGDFNEVIGEESGQPRAAARKPPAARKANPKNGKIGDAQDTKKEPAPIHAVPKAEAPKQETASPAAQAIQENHQPAQNDQGAAPKLSEAQKRAVANLARRRGISTEDLEAMCVNTYGVTLEHLNSKDAGSFIRELQSAA